MKPSGGGQLKSKLKSKITRPKAFGELHYIEEDVGASWCPLAKFCLCLRNPAIPPQGVFSGGKYSHLSARGVVEGVHRCHVQMQELGGSSGIGCPPLGLGGRLARRRGRRQMCIYPAPLKHTALSKESKKYNET